MLNDELDLDQLERDCQALEAETETPKRCLAGFGSSVLFVVLLSIVIC